jgi:hypothetical protein
LVLLLCAEASDGNVHGHEDMPFAVAGRAGGAHRGGRIVDAQRRADLLFALANMGGSGFTGFGQACAGELPGLRTT